MVWMPFLRTARVRPKTIERRRVYLGGLLFLADFSPFVCQPFTIVTRRHRKHDVSDPRAFELRRVFRVRATTVANDDNWYISENRFQTMCLWRAPARSCVCARVRASRMIDSSNWHEYRVVTVPDGFNTRHYSRSPWTRDETIEKTNERSKRREWQMAEATGNNGGGIDRLNTNDSNELTTIDRTAYVVIERPTRIYSKIDANRHRNTSEMYRSLSRRFSRVNLFSSFNRPTRPYYHTLD